MKFSRLLRIAVVGVLTAIAAGLAGCSGAEAEQKTRHLSLTLNSYPNPQHAGIYMAQKLGYFEDEGLDVSIKTPTDPATPTEELAAGRTDLALTYEPEVIHAADQGQEVVAVGALINHTVVALIWLKGSGVGEVADLRGKTIATLGIPYQEELLKLLLADAGLKPADVNVVHPGYNLQSALTSGRAQAIVGFNSIDGVGLLERGRNAVINGFDDLGLPLYEELVLATTRKQLEDDPEAVRLFAAALARGTAAAEKDHAAALEAVRKANPNANPKPGPVALQETLALLVPTGPAPRYGYMNPAEWQRYIGWMRDQGLISSQPSPDDVMTDAYLPRKAPE
jgi:putative hydroxymethylpyrimidine transport system substrate-binding protein